MKQQEDARQKAEAERALKNQKAHIENLKLQIAEKADAMVRINAALDTRNKSIRKLQMCVSWS